ncbi:MAG: DMT family transporter [Hyphomicrobiaceae bacterium]|nr:DMT family transporter [Hyphomicrobiaceae bacterium]
MISRLFNALYANAYLLLSLTALFWAGNFVVGRGMHEHVPPIALAWARWTLASLIILPFALPHIRRDWPIIRKNLPILFFFGTIGVGAFNSLSYSGLNYTTALNALVLQSSGPILIVLASVIFFRDRVSLRQGLGIALSVIGVLFMVSRGDVSVLTGFVLNRGDILIVSALVLWGLYTAFLRKRPDIHWLSFIGMTFVIGAVVNAPFAVWEHSSGRHLQFNVETAAVVAYVAVFPSILAYIFYNRGVALIGANRAGVCLNLVPLFGAILAIVFLGEQPRAYHLFGIALIVAGVTMAARKD